MLVKLLAILFILVGIAGLVLPVVPGILLITAGFLLLYRERHEEVGRLINGKAPAFFAELYNKYLHNIMAGAHYVGIDWDNVKKEVVRTERLNNASADKRSSDIRASLDAAMRKARSLVLPRYTHEEKNIRSLGAGSIELDGGIDLKTGKVSNFIKGAEKIVAFAVTLGDALEKEASVLTSGKDVLGGYLLDRIGSFAVESLADNLEKKLRKDYAKNNMSLSSRFSPGYCDWPVEEQFKLSRVIDFSKAGIELTPGCMMVPKKSVSAIAAVAREGVFKDFISSCDICEKQDCGFKRKLK